MAKIAVESGQFGWDFLIVKATGKRKTILVQTDFDYPGYATTFGWSPCHPCTDGTIGCRECGNTASDLIAAAGEFLREQADSGEEVDDPGYFG